MKTKPQTISSQKLKKELLKNKKFKLEYESQSPEFQIACQIIEARLEHKTGKLKPWPVK